MTQWLSDFRDLFARVGEVPDEQGLAVLRLARSLHANPRTPWASAGFVWLEGLVKNQGVYKNVPDDRPLQALDWLLKSGLPVDGAFFSVEGMPLEAANKAIRAYHDVIRSSPRKNKKVEALYQGLPFRETRHPSLSTPWLGRTFWAGRAHPQLPQLVDRWLEAGADPSDVLPSSKGELTADAWSSWPIALMSGRLDALQRLVDHGPVRRPPDWARAVKHALLGAAGLNHASRLGVVEAVRWFVQQFPPTPEEVAQVSEALNKNDTESRVALSAWLSLPCVDLATVGAIPGLDGFNPWSLALGGASGLEGLGLDMINALQAHPVWGRGEHLSSARVKIRLVDGGEVSVPLLEATLLAEEKIRLRPMTEAVLALASRWDVKVSKAFASRLAHSYDAPGTLATQWLLERREQWAGEAEGFSPWHAGIANDSVLTWLVKHGVSGSGVDARGNTGWGNALAYALTRKGDQQLTNLMPVLAKQRLVGSEKGWGRTVSAWVASREPGVVDLRVRPAEPFDAACAIMDTMDVKAASNLFQAPEVWQRFTSQQQRDLLDRWAAAKPPMGSGDPYLSSEQRLKANIRAAKLLKAMVGKTKAVELGLDLCGWIHRVGLRHRSDQDNWNPITIGRHDLVGAIEFMEGVNFLALTGKDRRTLGRWVFDSMVTQQGHQAPSDPEHVYPWSTATARALAPLERSALARSWVRWLGSSRFKPHPGFGLSDAAVHLITASCVEALVLEKRAQLADGLKPEQYVAWRRRLDALPAGMAIVSNAWRADLSARVLGEALPVASPRVSKPRF